jgi:uncharacterized RmlC-like cupin family protein
MAKAAPKRKTSAKKGARKNAAPEVVVRKTAAKAAVKKAAPKKAAPKKAAPKKAAPSKAASAKRAAPKKAVAKAAAKRPVGRPPGKTAVAAKRPVGRPPAKSAAAAKTTAKRPLGRPPGRKVPAAKVAVRRPLGRPPGKKAPAVQMTAKRGRVATPLPRLATRAGKQRFTVSHANEADFKTDGLRAYAQYRDLGIAAASSGLCQAHVIRLIPPCTDEVRKRHVHDTELQLIYVLKGWIKNEFEGHGVQMMSAGSCWLQPPGIEHTVLDYSADCEMLEIIVPADFKTVDLT